MEVMKMKNESGVIGVIITIFLGILVLGFIGFAIYCSTVEYQNEETIEIVVKDKYIKRSGNTDLYLVVSEDNETYKIEDLLFKGKFNSTDLYNQLEIGKKYRITTTGIRLQYFSMYKNINKIEAIDN